MSRLVLRGAALLAAAVLVTSCGSDTDAEPADATGGGPTSSGAFPVTVSTASGDVTVEEEPARVVALGWSDAETALALGVQPVGASDWLGFGGEGVGPWAEGRCDEAPEIIETLEPSLEAIAALQDDVDQQFADATAAHPEFDGTEVAVAAYTSEGFGAYVRGDGRVDVMESLGFTNAPAVQDLAGENFFVPVSEEQLPLLDAGLTVAFPIFVDAGEIADNPLWQAVPSVQAGHSVVMDDETLVSAFSSSSALGIQYALENAVPLFAAAL
jgi:iron complex transport system substrate-binding protein